ncbi:NUDIX domain-containing protein [Tateyamaria omphalii]|uniref:NUDIX hydrolase n=1 Tax=Tateyamaria omphalii TaxID=299262 RepID=UPI001C99BFC3|nr:NUDIX domain-containing protein [Tateyamaria omphalii]MBY5934576.1 NUDIX domain-containing protein [Tateyamaria omphalii]
MSVDWQRAAAYVVAFDAQRQVLLTQFEKTGHPKSGAWTLPGGGMEWGEAAHETALRELKEETGLCADIGALLGAQSEWFDEGATERGQRGLAIRLIFEAQNCSGELKTDFSDDDTTVGAAWFTVGEVQHLNRVEVVDFGLSLISRTRGPV